VKDDCLTLNPQVDNSFTSARWRVVNSTTHISEDLVCVYDTSNCKSGYCWEISINSIGDFSDFNLNDKISSVSLKNSKREFLIGAYDEKGIWVFYEPSVLTALNCLAFQKNALKWESKVETGFNSICFYDGESCDGGRRCVSITEGEYYPPNDGSLSLATLSYNSGAPIEIQFYKDITKVGTSFKIDMKQPSCVQVEGIVDAATWTASYLKEDLCFYESTSCEEEPLTCIAVQRGKAVGFSNAVQSFTVKQSKLTLEFKNENWDTRPFVLELTCTTSCFEIPPENVGEYSYLLKFNAPPEFQESSVCIHSEAVCAGKKVCVSLSSFQLPLNAYGLGEFKSISLDFAPPNEDLVALSFRQEGPFEIIPVAANYSFIPVENPEYYIKMQVLGMAQGRQLETCFHSKENCAISTNGTAWTFYARIGSVEPDIHSLSIRSVTEPRLIPHLSLTMYNYDIRATYFVDLTVDYTCVEFPIESVNYLNGQEKDLPFEFCIHKENTCYGEKTCFDLASFYGMPIESGYQAHHLQG
jgi:hypothetical protein